MPVVSKIPGVAHFILVEDTSLCKNRPVAAVRRICNEEQKANYKGSKGSKITIQRKPLGAGRKMED